MVECCGHGHEHGEAQAQPVLPQDDGVQRTAMRIGQMDCPTEEGLIRDALGGMGAVRGLHFNLVQRVLTVDHEPQALDSIVAAIRRLGFEPELPGTDARERPAAPQTRWWPLTVGAGLAAAAEAAHWLGLPWGWSAVPALLAIAVCGLGTYRKGWVAIRHGNLNINALMSVAVTGAMLIGQWPEAAMVMVLFALAEAIEARSLDRARNAIESLMQLSPDTADVRQEDGAWAPRAVADVPVGSVVRARPGERIAMDGTVSEGASSVDQSPITGESLPVDKAPGAQVFAGSINQSGMLQYRVTAPASGSTLARIIQAVEQAQGAKAPTQRFVDRFARIYTPAVVLLAALVAVVPPLFLGGPWLEWVYNALVLLVIACPCALVISTPVSIVSGLTSAAREGILVKGGNYLESARHLKWLALDKTGTITHGKPRQTSFQTVGDLSEGRCRQLAASLAMQSDHPVSRAIAEAAGRDVTPLSVQNFHALPGTGVRGEVDGTVWFLGNHRLVHDMGVCTPELEARLQGLERQGNTAVLLANEEQVFALFAVADTVRATSRDAIAELHQLGVKTVMLSGDNTHTAHAIARQVGIDEARGDQLPADKLLAIEDFGRDAMVGMVGDGINDAPALARADVGFAMGVMGTDTAIETADVALMDDDLRKIPALLRLSHRTHAVLVQNIVLALAIKAVFLGLTLAGMGTLWMAVVADVGASLLVVANGLRLLGGKARAAVKGAEPALARSA